MLGQELIKEMEQEVLKIRKNLKETQDRQKSYAYKHRVNREFSVGDHVYLRVRARKSSLKLGSCPKLSPRYCGSFEVLERIGLVYIVNNHGAELKAKAHHRLVMLCFRLKLSLMVYRGMWHTY